MYYDVKLVCTHSVQSPSVIALTACRESLKWVTWKRLTVDYTGKGRPVVVELRGTSFSLTTMGLRTKGRYLYLYLYFIFIFMLFSRTKDVYCTKDVGQLLIVNLSLSLSLSLFCLKKCIAYHTNIY